MGGIFLGVGGCLFIPCCIAIYLVQKQMKGQGAGILNNSSYPTTAPQDNQYGMSVPGQVPTHGQPPAPQMGNAPGYAQQPPPMHTGYAQQPPPMNPGYAQQPPPMNPGYAPGPPPPGPPQPAYGQPPLPPNWAETKDPNTGDTYYYNSMTNQTSWDRPGDYVNKV